MRNLTGPRLIWVPSERSQRVPEGMRVPLTHVPLLLSRSLIETLSRLTRRKQCRRLTWGAERRRLQSEPRPMTMSCRTVILRTLDD